MALEARSLEDDIGDGGETLVRVWRTGQLQSDCTQTWTRSAHSLETSIADPAEIILGKQCWIVMSGLFKIQEY